MSRNPGTHDASLADFVPMVDGRTRLLVRRGWEDAAEHLSDPDTIRAGETVAGGREAHPVTTLPNGARVVVRRYRRGGMMRWVNRVVYFGGNRAFDELRATERARAGGVRAPVVVAAIERPARLAGYRAWLATELVAGGVDFAAWLAVEGGDETRRRAVLAEAGRQMGMMHAAGVAHPDVNLRNLLVAPGHGDPEVYLLDFDRADVGTNPVSAARRVRDLRRLARSARKLRTGLAAADWLAFRAGYGDDWPPGLDLAKPPKEELRAEGADAPGDEEPVAGDESEG
ncbi:lipopolysaccharide kinase InaA family protein [Longimicrobium sp.]|uniref:lipopolysaccharide kinase InaA family protein n=1 Tax=Longimicrobium sp. TaxID=2029185 RepID=UPI002BD9C072|nr:lipopolysaccharide kinase InaA family protein [Longimicrobium sp.]HSU12944.1 lipopolysaccharide kinase InaA family protein [Longimicrobium sp.]